VDGLWATKSEGVGLIVRALCLLQSLAYIFAADSMGVSSFKFVQWAPKDASILQQSAAWPKTDFDVK